MIINDNKRIDSFCGNIVTFQVPGAVSPNSQY